MRQRGSLPQEIECGQQCARVLELLVMRLPREVDHHTVSGIPECTDQISRGWRGGLAAEDRDAGQPLERGVVPLRVEHTDRIAVQDQLLAQEARNPGFAGCRIPGDQHVASANRQRELVPVFRVAEQQPPAGTRRDRKAPVSASVRT